jgi:methylmalonyl-CoA/ethylmalonyl-CoA epimerase
MKLDHLGLVVEDIQKYFDEFLKPVLGIKELSEIYSDYNQQSKVAFVKDDKGCRIELIEPMNASSPVSQVLKKKRGSLHHMCFIAEDFEQDIKRLRDNKCLMISPPNPAVAFDGRRVVFFFTPTYEVIEIVEQRKNKHS